LTQLPYHGCNRQIYICIIESDKNIDNKNKTRDGKCGNLSRQDVKRLFAVACLVLVEKPCANQRKTVW
jgi:hypothetical protein